MYTNLILVSFSVTVCLLLLYIGTINNTTVNTDSTEEPKSEKSDLSIVIIGGAVAIIGGIIMIALVMVFCALCFFRCKKKSTSQRRRTNEYHKKQPIMKFANEYEMK